MFQIIKANTVHSEFISQIGKASFLDAHGKSASTKDIDSYLNNSYTSKAIKTELQYPENIYHLIYDNNEVAGFSKLVLHRANPCIDSPAIAVLDRLYLSSSFYGKNLAKELLDFNIDLAKTNLQKGIWLAVWVGNQRAIRFYTKNKFEIVGAYDFQISATHANPNHIMYLDF